MTLAEFSAIIDRYREQEDLAFLRSGIIASVIANCNRDPKHEPFTPQDFMPHTPKPAHEPTQEEVMADMRALNALFGGEDKTDATR